MPIFEFICVKCKASTEIILSKYKDRAYINCPKCDGMARIVDVNRTSFRLMPGGSGGFYSPSKS